MKIICRYSGVAFQSSGFNSLKIERGEHPIMTVNYHLLLSHARQWFSAEMTDTERRLLFIALLKSTDLFEFRVPAIPSDALIQRYMFLLMKTISWIQALDDAIPLPGYVVDKDHCRLTNLKQWLDKLEDAKEDWRQQGALYAFRQKMALREAALHRLIRSKTKNYTHYSGMLGRWALEATNTPKPMVDYWLSIFMLKDNVRIWGTPLVDIEELLDWLTAGENGFIDSDTIIGKAALDHIRRVHAICKAGPRYGLGIEDFDLDNIMESPYTILANPEEEAMITAAALAPDHEPSESEYTSRVDYFRAIARWRIAQRLKTVEEQLEARQKRLDFEAVQDQDEESSTEDEDPKDLGIDPPTPDEGGL